MASINTKAVIAAAGGPRAVAVAIGVSQQAVYQWMQRGIPVRRARSVADLSGVPIEHLLADIF